MIGLTVDAWTLDQLLTFDASTEDLEDADGEPEPDDEIDGPPTSACLTGIEPARDREELTFSIAAAAKGQRARKESTIADSSLHKRAYRLIIHRVDTTLGKHHQGLRQMHKLFTAASIVLLASCAGRAPNPVMVSQGQDSAMTCQAIQAEMRANTSNISELGSEQGAKTAQNIAAGVAGLFIWPLWFAMDFQGAATKEVAALEARNSYLAGRALHSCAAVAQIERIALAAGPRARPGGGTVHEPHVIVQPSRGPTETSSTPRSVEISTGTPSTPRRVEVINARPPAPAADVPAAVQPGDSCAKYKNTPTESRCRLYVGPNGWQSIPPVGRTADLDTQLRCAPIRRNLTSYERCISSSDGDS